MKQVIPVGCFAKVPDNCRYVVAQSSMQAGSQADRQAEGDDERHTGVGRTVIPGKSKVTTLKYPDRHR